MCYSVECRHCEEDFSPTWQSHFNNREIATSSSTPRNDTNRGI